MAATVVRLLLSFFPLFFFMPIHIAASTCDVSACSASGSSVRFPFWLSDRQKRVCGYSSDFDVSCNNNETILNLPYSGNFRLKGINYRDQLIWINDRDDCMFKRFLDDDLSLVGSPFRYAVDLQEYTFYNCSPSLVPTWSSPIFCLSGDSFEVIGVPTSTLSRRPPLFCDVITRALVPALSYQLSNSNFGVRLTWEVPDCRSCEERGGVCGLQSDSKSKIQCSPVRTHGLTKAARYGMAIGIVFPGLLLITFCAFVVYTPRTERGRLQESISTTGLSATSTNHHQPQVIIAGLDGVTIESYPKTQLGENLELPDSNDKTCTICLGEYQPMETPRTIPECNHYFHASCIDEWLRKNPTCPLCRNSLAPSRNPPEVLVVRASDDYAIY